MSPFKTNPKENYSKPWKSKIKTIEGKMIKPIEDRMIRDIRNLCEQAKKDWNEIKPYLKDFINVLQKSDILKATKIQLIIDINYFF